MPKSFNQNKQNRFRTWLLLLIAALVPPLLPNADNACDLCGQNDRIKNIDIKIAFAWIEIKLSIGRRKGTSLAVGGGQTCASCTRRRRATPPMHSSPTHSSSSSSMSSKCASAIRTMRPTVAAQTTFRICFEIVLRLFVDQSELCVMQQNILESDRLQIVCQRC
jgi:hypothetical protein